MKTKSGGFALLEVIISIVLLGFFLAGASSLIWSAINASQRNRDRITATYLTQECLELARNARDTAWRRYLPWDCAFDTDCSQQNNLAGSINKNYISLGDNSSRSKFGRNIFFDLNNDDTVKITCETYWQIKGDREGEIVSMSQVLTNWKKK